MSAVVLLLVMIVGVAGFAVVLVAAARNEWPDEEGLDWDAAEETARRDRGRD